ncbi:hypothetical protein DV736_g4444, partial [Chaetothyriales sp. CBS 134916]
MGVTGLWTVVAPTARPTSLGSLNRKRLAVDASIWIYQFLKAVRDKEGNALRNSHVVGFFRRICKLLYFGIKPVFVFDGGAPSLKRETVLRRRRRREGRRDDAVRTAAKLGDESELVYVDEIGMDKAQRQRERRQGFRKTDQYHLPDLDVSIESLRGVDDPRIMSQAELEDYARHFHSGEDINLYDFSKIDFESPFFLSLPAGDRYNILNAARLRSRLRMGYSKEQLDAMFPDRMAFSRFQIERVRERNELTQRLMHINGMTEFDINQGGRIAGEKGKEYVLVRNEGVEGGWALGVVSNKQGTNKEDAIDLDALDDEEVGLNRLPRAWKRKRKDADYDMSYEDAAAEIARKRKAVYDARKQAAKDEAERQHQCQIPTIPAPTVQLAEPTADSDSLFVAQDSHGAEYIDDGDDTLFEDVDIEPQPDEDDDLQLAIAMSLEQPTAFTEPDNTVPKFVHDKEDDDKEDDDLGFDLQTALTESRKSKTASKPNGREPSPYQTGPAPKFDGPLPFESLNLGQSLLGKKKAKKVEEDLSGGFDRNLGDDALRKERPPQPMPSWFDAAPRTEDLRLPRNEDNNVTSSRQNVDGTESLRQHPPTAVIDLEAEAEPPPSQNEPVDISSDEEQDQRERQQDRERHEWEMPEEVVIAPDAQEEAMRNKEEQEREERYRVAREIAGQEQTGHAETADQVTGDVAEDLPARPPSTIIPATERVDSIPTDDDDEGAEWSNFEAGGQDATSLSPTPEAPRLAGPEAADAPVADDEEEEFEDVHMQSSAPSPLAQLPPQDMSALPREATMEQYLLPEEDEVDTRNGSHPVQTDGQDYQSESDAEEEELMRQLVIEAEEHARFANSLNNTSNKTPQEAARDYENELKQLRNQQKRDRRDADEVTHVMIQECQALLSLFGLPYITAPMEAEAQCAELVHLGLVDGIVTDDSDIFLFGGTRIYKNMFNAAKFVECYLASDLEKEYALDRRKLIRFAHLLGSDYTEGIPGVGPVTALEIITDFTNLDEFKDWCAKVQLGRPQDLENQLTTPFRRKFKRAAQKRIFMPPHFPDHRVDDAYLNPEVDNSPEEFQWGIPDLDKLRSFLMATVGWSQERTDEILVPVVRDMNKRELEGTQTNITRFFTGLVGVGANPNNAAASVGAASGGDAAVPRNRTGKESGRMKNAYKRLRGEAERRKKRG